MNEFHSKNEIESEYILETNSIVQNPSLYAGDSILTSKHTLYAKLRFFQGDNRDINVAVYLNKHKLLDTFQYREVTDYISIMPGKYLLEIYENGLSGRLLTTKNIRVQKNIYYTLFLINTHDCKTRISLVIDDPSVPIDETKLRIIHLSLEPALFDVAVKGRDVIFENIFFNSQTNYLGLSPMTIDLEVRIAGSKNVILPLPKLKFSHNRTYTVPIIGDCSTPPFLEALLLEDGEN